MKGVLTGLVWGLCGAPTAWAQSLCNSDGQATPLTLVEHFISADCEACWRAAPTAKPGPRALSLDWIVPSGRGDDAALSAAAIREAQIRLDALGQARPAAATVTTTKLLGRQAGQLRVAQGATLGGYIGTIIEYKTKANTRSHQPFTAWLLLVETLPAGVEGTQTEKSLVRNVLIVTWDKPDQRSATGQAVYRELRPLSIPQGAKPERLRLIGWVQDARGQVLSAAQSVCATTMETR